MKIAAIADLHCGKASEKEIQVLLDDIEQNADVLVMPGDLTHRGLIREIKILIAALETMTIPKIAVLGNHDHQNNQEATLIRMLRASGVHVLDATSCMINEVGFIGTKGFCGGFEDMRIQPFGEQAIKAFVDIAVKEADRLDSALTRLQADRRVVVLHYAPIRETLFGEPPELFPFLGTSLFAAALDRHSVHVVFHGHSHHGAAEGLTLSGTPVQNVCRFVQNRFHQRDYMLYEL